MFISFDCETYPIVQVGKATTKTVPRLVCMSYYHPGLDGPVVLERERAVKKFKEWVENDAKLVGHNITFDVLVMTRALTEEYGGDWSEETFDLYADARVFDNILHRQLKRVETKGTTKETSYSLAYMAKKYCNISLSGKSGGSAWRMRYNELDGLRAEDYPETAYWYAAKDAKVTWDVWQALTGGKHCRNEYFQLCADLALNLCSAWGAMVDQDHVDWLYAHYMEILVEKEHLLIEGGIRVDGVNKQAKVRELFKKAWQRLGRPPKMTDSGKNISTSGKTLQLLDEAGYFELDGTAEDQKLMHAYSEYKTANKFIATYLDPLKDAGEHPVCSRFTTFVDSGRTSSSGPNVQNFPAHLNPDEKRKKAEGYEGPFGKDIRGCIVPRPGCVFMVADYDQIEMVALAQVMRNIAGETTPMGQMLNEGLDPHVYLLSEYLGRDYDELMRLYKDGDEEVDYKRFLTKGANYAFGGGAKASTYVDFMKGFGVNISQTVAEKAYNAYHRAYPGVKQYHFADIDRYEIRHGRYEIPLHGPNRARSGWRMRVCDRFTQAANTRFQSLVGDGFKKAAWEIQKACYCTKSSPIYDDRMILPVHDEFVLEIKDENREAKAREFQRLMVDEGMNLFIPDTKVGTDVEFQEERWSK